jgi:O-antigen/teichoic acid export membrane protein
MGTLERDAARWAFATVAGRGVAMLAVLAAVPLLLAALGAGGFAAWAVLHGSASFLGLLELGATPTLIRYLAAPIRDGERARVDAVLSSAFYPLAAVVLAALALLWPLAAPLSDWLCLPDAPLLDGAGLLRLTLVCFAAQVVLGVLFAPLAAAERFVLAGALGAANTALAHAAAVIAALATRRLDLSLLAFWAVRLGLLALALPLVRARVPYALRLRLVRASLARALFVHGGKLQASQLCELVNAQFDKLIIPGFVSLAAVAPYEAACRAHFGARSFPLAVVSVLLPAAADRHERGADLLPLYRRATRIAVLGALLCLLAPLALAPLLFPAWLGEAGAGAAVLFSILLPGIAANVATAPVSTVLQASGRPGLQAAVAAGALALNVALSLLLIGPLGVHGAAAGTSLSMVATAACYLVIFHRRHAASLAATLRESLRPALALLPLLALLWLCAALLARHLDGDRLGLGLTALGLALAFAPLAALALLRWGGLDARERAAFAALPGMPRLTTRGIS